MESRLRRIHQGRLLLIRFCFCWIQVIKTKARSFFGAAASIRRQLCTNTGSKWALEALQSGFRAPDQAQKEAQRAPERVPNGASEEGKDDPEAARLKREGAKSSKMGNIQKWALNEYGKQIFKE